MNLKKFEYKIIGGERTIEDLLDINENRTSIILHTNIKAHENESILTSVRLEKGIRVKPCPNNFYRLEYDINENGDDVLHIKLIFNCKCIIKKNTQIFKLEG